MQARIDRGAKRRRIRYRIRKKVSGTPERPRLAVFRSEKHIYVQAIDDAAGETLAQASSLESEVREKASQGSNIEAAKLVGTVIAGRLKEKGVTSAVFDRGGNIYHGRVRALAEAVRAAGLEL